MATGTEILMERMMKAAFANLPPDVLTKVGQIAQNVASFAAQLNRIEENQRLILSALGHPLTEENEHGPAEHDRPDRLIFRRPDDAGPADGTAAAGAGDGPGAP